MTESGDLQGVCRTANYIAAARAIETKLKNAIINDPWAEEFAGEDGFRMLEHFKKYRMASTFALSGQPEEEENDLSVMITAIRTRFMDDQLIKALQEDTEIQQVVIVGCGFDTRSCRLPFPNTATKVFELDLPDVIKRREEVLGSQFTPINQKKGMPPRAQRISVSVDVSDSKEVAIQLADASFNPTKKTVWILEGLLVYLTEAKVHQLLHFISTSSPEGSVLLADIHNPATIFSSYNKMYNDDWAQKGAPLLWASDDPEDTMRWHGFSTTICCRYGEKEANFGRFFSCLSFLLDGFPRENKGTPNTFLFLGKRMAGSAPNEWQTYLKLQLAEKQLEQMKKWIVPERTGELNDFLCHVRSQLFQYSPPLPPVSPDTSHIGVEVLSMDDLDTIPEPLIIPDDLD